MANPEVEYGNVNEELSNKPHLALTLKDYQNLHADPPEILKERGEEKSNEPLAKLMTPGEILVYIREKQTTIRSLPRCLNRDFLEGDLKRKLEMDLDYLGGRVVLEPKNGNNDNGKNGDGV